jgi:hypothetical protein
MKDVSGICGNIIAVLSFLVTVASGVGTLSNALSKDKK